MWEKMGGGQQTIGEGAWPVLRPEQAPAVTQHEELALPEGLPHGQRDSTASLMLGRGSKMIWAFLWPRGPLKA